MITIMFLLSISAAAFSKAVADTLAHHFDTSVFKKLNPKFWDYNMSQNEAKVIFKYKLDGWHLFNSAMITFFIIACCLYKLMIEFIFDILIIGTLWNLVFNLFYNKILRKWN